MRVGRDPIVIGSTTIRPKHLSNCETKGIVYLLTGGCNTFYVGKTARMFWQLVKEHVDDISDEIPESPIARHFEKLLMTWGSWLLIGYTLTQGGDLDNAILCSESRWIFTLRADYPPGLNGFV